MVICEISGPFISLSLSLSLPFSPCQYANYLLVSDYQLYSISNSRLNGSSSVSETYGNPCLAHSEDFEVKEVELWGFVYGSKYEEVVALSRTEAPGICRWWDLQERRKSQFRVLIGRLCESAGWVSLQMLDTDPANSSKVKNCCIYQKYCLNIFCYPNASCILMCI